jgi:enoyl-CoA hydratase
MIHIEPRGPATVLRLDHGKVNALDTELCEELERCLGEVGSDTPGAVVLTGTGSVFSAGVDLFRVLDGGRRYVESFLPALTRSFEALFTFPRPVVAALNGHAVAGGAILAWACDHRVMARGTGRIGVPEQRVGVPFPTLALEILRHGCPPAHLQELVCGGRTYTPEEALAWGLVDELAEADAVLERALEVAATYAAIPAATFRLTKRQLRRPSLERTEAYAPTFDREVTEIWSAEETREVIQSYLERTLGKGR